MAVIKDYYLTAHLWILSPHFSVYWVLEATQINSEHTIDVVRILYVTPWFCYSLTDPFPSSLLFPPKTTEYTWFTASMTFQHMKKWCLWLLLPPLSVYLALLVVSASSLGFCLPKWIFLTYFRMTRKHSALIFFCCCFKFKQVLFVCFPTSRNSYSKPVYI